MLFRSFDSGAALGSIPPAGGVWVSLIRFHGTACQVVCRSMRLLLQVGKCILAYDVSELENQAASRGRQRIEQFDAVGQRQTGASGALVEEPVHASFSPPKTAAVMRPTVYGDQCEANGECGAMKAATSAISSP